jgi:hypothetical protein
MNIGGAALSHDRHKTIVCLLEGGGRTPFIFAAGISCSHGIDELQDKEN